MGKKIFNTGELINEKRYNGELRPVVIIEDIGDSCIVIPIITHSMNSNINQKNSLFLGKNNYLAEDSIINIQSVTTVKKTAFKDSLGRLDDEELNQIVSRLSKEYSGVNSLQLISYANNDFNRYGQEVDDYLRNDRNELLTKKYDIFLSHSSMDKNEIAGLKSLLTDQGFEVYVDWLDDPKYKRENVTRETAERIKIRMRNSKCLLFAFSKNSRKSIWMPWELGFFDGLDRKVVIMPIERIPFLNKKFKGQEYLDLYEYIAEQNSTRSRFRVVTENQGEIDFGEWIREIS